MRKIHTVLRLHFDGGLNWPLPSGMGERELTDALFPERTAHNAHARFKEPDYPRIHLELKAVGMTKQLAWEEYRQTHPNVCQWLLSLALIHFLYVVTTLCMSDV